MEEFEVDLKQHIRNEKKEQKWNEGDLQIGSEHCPKISVTCKISADQSLLQVWVAT